MSVSNIVVSISKRMGKAIADYDMLQDNDKVIIAVSGGKDSLALLNVMLYRQSFIPINVELLAVHIDYGLPGFPTKRLIEYFQEKKIKYIVEKIDFLKEPNMENTNCFWCSWNRRKALFEIAAKLGFNKIALAHHMDDIVETILLNMFFNAEIGAMKPKQELFGGKITIIRPLAYETEEQIMRMAQKEGFDKIDEFDCPNKSSSKREMVKRIISDIGKINPAVKINIFRSLKNIKEDYLL